MPAAQQKPRWWKRTTPLYATLIVAFVAILVGGATTFATVYPHVTALAERASAAETKAADEAAARQQAEGRVRTLEADAQRVATQSEQVDQRNAAADAREAELDEREAAIAAAEQRVAESSFGDGVWVVGADITAGTYRTEGIVDCYYAWLTGTGADADIVDNNIVSGTATISVSDGNVFESNRCGTWTKVG